MESTYSLMVVDPDNELDQSFRAGKSASDLSVQFYSSAEAAAAEVLNTRKNIAGVIINPLLPRPGGLALIAHLIQHRPATPIFMMHDGQAPFAKDELTKLTIHGMVRKPFRIDTIRSRFSPEIFKQSAPRPTLLPTEEAKGFVPVPASDFLTGLPCSFDIFIQLPSGRQLKLQEAGTAFAPERVLDYIRKGVTHFHIKRETQARCLTYCHSLALFLTQAPNVSPALKVAETMNRGSRIADVIRKNGLDAAHLEFTGEFVEDLQRSLTELQLKDKPSVSVILRHLAHHEHAVAVAMTAGLLALPLGIESRIAFRSLGLAAFLHDIGLYQLPRELHHEKPEVMTEERRRLYYTHPELGAEILSKFSGIDSTVIQAVAQHHERRDGRGFPGKVSPENLNRIAEVVGLAEEFITVLETTGPTFMEFMPEMRHKVLHRFSAPIAKAFESLW